MAESTKKTTYTEDSVRTLGNEELMATIEREDPECEHDDLHEPDGELAHLWREAGRRGLIDF